MKIAVWHNLPSGGGKRALYYHIKGLVERGHEVEVWCPTTADAEYLPLRNFAVEHRDQLQWRIPRLIGRFSSSAAWYRTNLAKINAMDEHCRRCAQEINRSGADVLFANTCSFFRVTSIARAVDVPTVLYLQEPYRWLYEALPDLPWRALPSARSAYSLNNARRFISNLIRVQGLRIQAREEYENARAFDMILVNSLFSRESVLRAYGLESKVCYLGVDTKLFKPTHAPKGSFVVGLGGIYTGKRIDRAIRALATIDKSRRPTLIWLGNSSDQRYQESMNELADELGVSIEFRVSVLDSEVIDTLRRASVMIYTPQLEPFGLAPLEANACGTPVVAIAEGGVRETVKHGINGFLVNDDDPHELGAAVMRLINDPELAKKMSRASREYVLKHWCWDNAIDRLEEFLHQAATQHA